MTTPVNLGRVYGAPNVGLSFSPAPAPAPGAGGCRGSARFIAMTNTGVTDV